jgi:hypothetical protein
MTLCCGPVSCPGASLKEPSARPDGGPVASNSDEHRFTDAETFLGLEPIAKTRTEAPRATVERTDDKGDNSHHQREAQRKGAAIESGIYLSVAAIAFMFLSPWFIDPFGDGYFIRRRANEYDTDIRR